MPVLNALRPAPVRRWGGGNPIIWRQQGRVPLLSASCLGCEAPTRGTFGPRRHHVRDGTAPPPPPQTYPPNPHMTTPYPGPGKKGAVVISDEMSLSVPLG